MRLRVFLAITVFLFLSTVFSTVHSAQTPSQEYEFSEALLSYRRGDYDSAIDKFKKLIDGLELTSIDKIIGAHSMLGASYYMKGDEQTAKEHFIAVLNFNPEYELPTADFDSKSTDFFNSLKGARKQQDISPSVGGENPAKALSASENSQGAEARSDSAKTLESVFSDAGTSREGKGKSSYLNSFIPFGVGQFKNGQSSKGYAFLIPELFFFASSLATFSAFEAIKRSDGTFENPSLGRGLRSSLYVSTAFFTTLAITGIIDAIINYGNSNNLNAARGEPSISLAPVGRSGLAFFVHLK